MWEGIVEFRQLSEVWAKLAFDEIDAKKISQITDKYARNVNKCKKNLPDNQVINVLMKMVWEYKDTMPVVTAMRSDKLLEDHWIDIKTILKNDFDIKDPNFTLQSLINMNVAQYADEIKEISVRAT